MAVTRPAEARYRPRRSNMRNHDEIDEAITRVLEAETTDFTELVKIARLDPTKDFRFANLSNMDFTGADLTGFDFTGSSIKGSSFRNARISGAVFRRISGGIRRLRRAADWGDFSSASA